MRVGFVEWPENLIADSDQWLSLGDDLSKAKVDILVTNELPFGPWIASTPDFDPKLAEYSIECHRAGVAALERLNTPAIISSRPVWEGPRLANEAFCLERGVIKHLHTKQYFPAELGWYEFELVRDSIARIRAGRSLRCMRRGAPVHGSDVQRTCSPLPQTRRRVDRCPESHGKNRGCFPHCRRDGLDCFRLLCREFQPRGTRIKWADVWRQRVRVRA